jgi:glycerol-3-phosphate dehydrogenase
MVARIQEFYDVVVIGGGIQGCGVAQATQSCGFTTLLLEKEDWAWATSSRSSKLIHGGLRYLQTGQFSLVKECLDERAWMLRKLPNLVKTNWFVIPFYKDSHYRRWQIHLGLWIYYALTGFAKQGRFRRIRKKAWGSIPGLNRENLEMVFAYQDAQTDDYLLTLAVKDSALRYGASCLNKARFISASRQGEDYRINFEYQGEIFTVNTHMVINATGPWVNKTLSAFSPQPRMRQYDFVQGTHIVISEKLDRKCFYLESPSDGRAVFVMPWRDKTLVGTTETLFDGEPDAVEPLPEEIDYLMEVVRHYFPDQPLTFESAFSGLRVLPQSGALPSFLQSRDVLLDVEDGLITICGGKLTAWRATAERVLREIEKQLGVGRYIDTRDLIIDDVSR